MLINMLDDVLSLRLIKAEAEDILTSVYTISEIELYISLINYLDTFFSKYSFCSEGLLGLKNTVSQRKDSESFKNLSENVATIRGTLNKMQSMTIGVNLDTNLRPLEAGVVSLNDNHFRSGNIIDRFLSADIKNDGYRCLTPLSPVKNITSPNRKRIFEMAFYFALEDIIKKSPKSWKPFITKYIADNTSEFLNMIGDMSFYLYFLKYFNLCKSKKLTLSLPKITDENSFYEKIYNINLANLSRDIVYNDITFDNNGMLYILTGPNQGGKSIFLKAVGINQALFQLGLYVHAKYANLKISNNILTYFTKNNEHSIGFGHLGEECNNMARLLKHVSSNTLILFDEPFSSTSLKDGLYILGEVVAALSDIDAYGIIITHIHEAFEYIKGNTQIKSDKIDSLVALMQSTETGQRSYFIVRNAPIGESYAVDIAKKYGIQRINILENAIK